MENPGIYLKGLREAANLSYQQIYEETRIRIDQMLLIEAGKIRELGDYGYARAIVHGYARFLDADMDRVMQTFATYYPDDLRSGYNAPTLPKEKRIMLSTNFLWSVLISVLCLSLAFILYFSYQRGYLKTPEFFKHSKADSVAVDTPPQGTKPDSLRTRLLQIRDSLPETDQDGQTPNKPIQRRPASRDTTDYIGIYLGDSPVNTDLR